MYFRGISPGFSLIQSQWFRQVQKAGTKFSGPLGAAPANKDPKTQVTDAIRMKLKAGKKLSAAELDFLRENDPELYAKAMRVALERETYEKSLRCCEDREEVKRLRFQQMSGAPKQDPEEAQMRMNALADADRAFRRSREYAALPEKKKEPT